MNLSFFLLVALAFPNLVIAAVPCPTRDPKVNPTAVIGSCSIPSKSITVQVEVDSEFLGFSFYDERCKPTVFQSGTWAYLSRFAKPEIDESSSTFKVMSTSDSGNANSPDLFEFTLSSNGSAFLKEFVSATNPWNGKTETITDIDTELSKCDIDIEKLVRALKEPNAPASDLFR